MAKVFIFHGTKSTPESNWFPWLRRELEKSGHTVFIPSFPPPPHHSRTIWLEEFEDYKRHVDANTIFVGHSIGCAFILSLLEQLSFPIKASFCIAGFLKKLNIPEFIELNKTFVEREFDWERIRQNCPKFYVINSDNDPYVPLEKGEELARLLGVNLTIVEGAGHFMASSGYSKFEFLLTELKKQLNNNYSKK